MIDPLKIHLIKILANNEFILSDCGDFLTEGHEISVSHKMMHNLEQEKVKITMLVIVFCSDNIKEIANYSYDFFYKIDDLESHCQIINEKPLFDGLFVSSLLAITYSTIRGILYAKFLDTDLKNLLLPIINIPDLLRK